MSASPSADWKAAASEARTAFPSSRWPATWVARSTVVAGCVLPLIRPGERRALQLVAAATSKATL
eukprot:scaffold75908_cov46-Phaeocystis_antarctica.AAC.1